jgi:hypothetical protein
VTLSNLVEILYIRWTPISPLVVEHGKEGARMDIFMEELYPLTGRGGNKRTTSPSLLYDVQRRETELPRPPNARLSEIVLRGMRATLKGWNWPV